MRSGIYCFRFFFLQINPSVMRVYALRYFFRRSVARFCRIIYPLALREYGIFKCGFLGLCFFCILGCIFFGFWNKKKRILKQARGQCRYLMRQFEQAFSDFAISTVSAKLEANVLSGLYKVSPRGVQKKIIILSNATRQNSKGSSRISLSLPPPS
jgi:hypothetical protein